VTERPQALEAARTCLAETVSRGSTTEERDAAIAWLRAAARDEHPGEVKRAVAKLPRSTIHHAPAPLPHIDALRRQHRRCRCAQRPAVLLYAGDHDPSGEDIDRDFLAKTDCWDEVRRVAHTAEQVAQYDLLPQPGKETDSRARGFIARHGRLVRVELDALPPEILQQLYEDAIAAFWDDDAYRAALELEATDRQNLDSAGDGGDGDA
jgi:hypothetical protein